MANRQLKPQTIIVNVFHSPGKAAGDYSMDGNYVTDVMLAQDIV